MGAGNEILTVLARIEAKLDRLLTGGGAAQPAQATASDADLDGQYGNPEVKKDPPRWSGDSHIGKRYSECTPAYLDEMAGFQAWTAGKDDAKAAAASDEAAKKQAEKNAWYARQRAGYARGWAARLRAGWKPPASEPSGDGW